MGEAILLIELAMEMVEEEEEGEEDEDEWRTAQYRQEIRCLLCCSSPLARSTQSALRYRIAPLSEPFSIPHFSTSRPTNACTGPGQLLYPPEELTRHTGCSARLCLKPGLLSAFTS
jgi:hypothetical protein